MSKIYNTFKIFEKNRNKILKNKEYISVLIFFIIFFIIDYFGIINLYGQNIIRRSINMYRRIDPLNYKNKLRPFCKKYDKILDKNDIAKMQSIKIPKNKDIKIFSRKNTTTHECCSNYSKSEIKIIREISEKIRDKYEKKINKKLYYLQQREPSIFVYYGNNSHHYWHVDPQNLEEIYNIIVCIKKKGNISPLQCKNKDGQAYSIHFEEGDAALFKGGTTIHQVPKNDDPNSERTVFSMAFTTSKKLSKKNDSKNMCVYIEGGNNYLNIFKIILIVFTVNLLLTHISGINNVSHKALFTFLAINILLAKYIPYYFDIGLGTGRSASIGHSLIIFIGFVLSTLSIKGAIVFFSYFLLSDLFFLRKSIQYD